MPLIVSCGDDLCSISNTERSLRYNFAYELAADKSLPQINFNNIEEKRTQNSLVWCSATGQIVVNPKQVEAVLAAISGKKKWKMQLPAIEQLNLENLSAGQIKTLRKELAHYLIHKDSIHIPENRNYVIDIRLNYAVNKKNSRLINVDFQDSTFELLLMTMLPDMTSNKTEMKVIKEIERQMKEEQQIM